MLDYQRSDSNDNKIYINCGTEYKMSLSNFFNNIEKINYGEIILNSIEDDGTGNGLNLEILKNP